MILPRYLLTNLGWLLLGWYLPFHATVLVLRDSRVDIISDFGRNMLYPIKIILSTVLLQPCSLRKGPPPTYGCLRHSIQPPCIYLWFPDSKHSLDWGLTIKTLFCHAILTYKDNVFECIVPTKNHCLESGLLLWGKNNLSSGPENYIKSWSWGSRL